MKESYKKNLKIAGLVLIGMIIGGLLSTPEPKVETKVETKTVTVEKVVEKAPASCIRALDIASEGYGVIGTSLTNGEPSIFTTWVDKNSPELAANSRDCRSKQ